MKKNKILLATGGTGGHIFPALALKHELDQQGFKTIIAADSKFVKFHPFDKEHILIPSANFSNRSPIKILGSIFTLAKGFIKSLWIIYRKKPDVVLGFGGYASYPIMLAATIFGKDIILHEANTVLGKVNKLLLPRVKYLTTGFKTIHGVKQKYFDKVIYTGNPIRPDILLDSNKKKTKSKGLSILIIGGSQGAKVFSKIIPDMIVNLPQTLKDKLYIYQQVKEEDIELIKERYSKENIACEIKNFFNDMNEKLAQVDLVIARAGASTISELIAFKLPAIFIPYPSAADNHQYYNAKEIEDLKAGWIVKEDAVSSMALLQIIKSIDKNPSILKEYSSVFANLKQNASKNIVDLVAKSLANRS